mmetsp:Transcript_13457/g.43839  ORF Transcript_13457/g.43839 Transcript_13457/m.43839 type:complete len:227 (+) Transcript_13457:1183-1863(+)
MMGPLRFAKAWMPPASSTTSAPGCTRRWYVLQNINWTSSAWLDSTAFNAPFVATGTKFGVSITPWGVRTRQTRAREIFDSCTTSNLKKSRSSHFSNVDASGPGSKPSDFAASFLSWRSFSRRFRFFEYFSFPVSSEYRLSNSASSSLFFPSSKAASSPPPRKALRARVMAPFNSISRRSSSFFETYRRSIASTSGNGPVWPRRACFSRRTSFRSSCDVIPKSDDDE